MNYDTELVNRLAWTLFLLAVFLVSRLVPNRTDNKYKQEALKAFWKDVFNALKTTLYLLYSIFWSPYRLICSLSSKGWYLTFLRFLVRYCGLYRWCRVIHTHHAKNVPSLDLEFHVIESHVFLYNVPVYHQIDAYHSIDDVVLSSPVH